MDAQDRQDYLDQMVAAKESLFLKRMRSLFLNSKGYVKRTTNVQVLYRKVLIIDWLVGWLVGWCFFVSKMAR